MKTLIALALLAFATPALADCQGVQSPLCAVDLTAGAFITCPAGAVSARITDGATFVANVSNPVGKVAFSNFLSAPPLQRDITATCTDAFGVAGSPTRARATFPGPAPLGAPILSGN